MERKQVYFTDIVNRDWLDGKKVAKKSLLIQNFFGAPVNNMIRKSALETVGYFDESFTYILDFDMWIRLSLQWRCIYYSPAA
ncbi:MAG: hypothetical protein ACLUN0_03285 [Roseburia sp.]